MATTNIGNPNPTLYPEQSPRPGIPAGLREEFSDAPAVVCGAVMLSYNDLHHRANCLAAHMRSHGVAPGSLVAVCLERSPEWVVSLLAAFKAEMAYLPLDPAYPPDRLAFMLKDSKAAAVVARSCTLERLSACNSVPIEIEGATAHGTPPVAPEALPTPPSGDLAYVIYTSGSTGQPKGVEITHGSLRNLIEWHLETFALTSADRTTLVSSPGFDAAVWEIWPALEAGASLYLPDDRTRLAPSLMRDFLVENRITVSFLPTPLAERIVRLDWPEDTALRTLLTGGDRLLRYPPEGLPFTVVNNYGPTECTVVAASTALDPNPDCTLLPPIGRPISNTSVYILDEGLKPVSAGEAGEIYIGGAGLARGYRNPCMNAGKFIANPFSDSHGKRLYRTGDLARYLPDGQIGFLGRTDEQVKIRGYRIEPAEIAATLNRHPGVDASFVACHDFGEEDKRLVAYIGAAGREPCESRDLREFLRASLPEYMVPSEFVFLDSLPLTANGKIDRAALPLPGIPAGGPRGSRPRTPVETRLTAVLGELLGMNDVGVDDDFFQLGGHSLLGAQLIARLSEDFGVELSLRTLFDHPTAAEIAAEIERLAGAQAGAMSEDEVKQLPR